MELKARSSRPINLPSVSIPKPLVQPIRRLISKRRGSATDDESPHISQAPPSPVRRWPSGRPAFKRGRVETEMNSNNYVLGEENKKNGRAAGDDDDDDDEDEESEDEEFRRVRELLKPLNPHRWSVSRQIWTATSLMNKVRRRRSSSVNEEKSRRTIWYPSSFKIITWNIDWDSNDPAPSFRHEAVLTNIQSKILKCGDGRRPEPCIILLQEVNRDAISVILDNTWLREHFIAMPASPADSWSEEASYGNLTLVSRKIPVVAAYTLDYSVSRMHRNAVFTDVRLKVPSSTPSSPVDRFDGESSPPHLQQEGTPSPSTPTTFFSPPKTVTIRIANTQLELNDEELRWRQLRQATGALHASHLAGGVVGGDMSAFNPQTEHALPEKFGLSDAWPFNHEIPWGMGGQIDEGYNSGATWGYQPLSATQPGRVDKILHTTKNGDGYVLSVGVPERIGKNLKANNGRSEGWASEHFGLCAEVSLVPISVEKQ